MQKKKQSLSLVLQTQVQLRRHESNSTDEGAVVLEGGSTFPNSGSYWLTVPFASDQVGGVLECTP